MRNVVLLKHLVAFPEHTTAYRIASKGSDASLVVLDTRASAYDRETYPTAKYAVLVSSKSPELTARALDFVPRGGGVIFKLASVADHDAVAASFPIEAKAVFLSYSAAAEFNRDEAVQVSAKPGDAAMDLFEAQGHPRTWVQSLLSSGRAFTCSMHVDGHLGSVCLAFESYGRVWEIGGVVTPGPLRGRGLAGRVVRTALAVLTERGLTPRYQVNGDNLSSLALARKIGLQHFLTLEHHLHSPAQSTAHAEEVGGP